MKVCEGIVKIAFKSSRILISFYCLVFWTRAVYDFCTV